MSKFMTQEEIAKLIGVSTTTIRRWEREEGLPVLRFGRLTRFDREAVWRWLDAKTSPSTNPAPNRQSLPRAPVDEPSRRFTPNQIARAKVGISFRIDLDLADRIDKLAEAFRVNRHTVAMEAMLLGLRQAEAEKLQVEEKPKPIPEESKKSTMFRIVPS